MANQTFPCYVHILDTFKAERKDQMSLKKGEYVRVLRGDEKDDNYWGEVLGKSGYFPNYYGEVVTEEQIPRANRELFRKLDKAKEKETLKLRKSSAPLAPPEDPQPPSRSPRATGSPDPPSVSPRALKPVSAHQRKGSAIGLGPRGSGRKKGEPGEEISVSGPIASMGTIQPKSTVGLRRLSNVAPSDEEKLYKGHTFGAPLAHLMFVGYDEFVIPPILRKTVAFLMQHLSVEGLFRISGSQDEIAEWKQRFNKSEPVEFVFGKTSPHDVAGLLKAWLRELPEPLLTFALFDDWMGVATRDLAGGSPADVASTLDVVRGLLQRLPLINRAVLTELFLFLREVTKMSAKNLMTAENIGVVIGPNILAKEGQDALTSATVMPASVGLTAFLVQHSAELFRDQGGAEERRSQSEPRSLADSRSQSDSLPAAAREAVAPARTPPPQRASKK